MSVLRLPEIDRTTVSASHGLGPSEPVVFDTFTGIFQAPLGPARAAVLLLSPLGYEELCSRAFWSSLADRLALAGAASLRFDYPGTANALDVESADLEDWAAATRLAADELRRRSGVAEIVALGQGLGGTLALHWADDLGALSGLALLEPAASGRTYLRGLTAWGQSIALSSGLDAKEQGIHTVAGFVLSDNRAAALKSLDLKRVAPARIPAVLLLERPDGPVRRLLTAEPWAKAIQLSDHSFPEFGALLTDPTSAPLPKEAVAKIVAWVSGLPNSGPVLQASLQAGGTVDNAVLVGDGFEELPVRFGLGERLAGILCRPSTAGSREFAVVLAGTGRDHSIGWGRSAVAQARELARSGVTNLRFDASSVGDSRAGPDAPEEILYSRQLRDDLKAAVDHLDRLGYRRFGLMGRCSGAWAAFTLATEDARISSLAIINLPYFIWNETKSLEEVLRFSQRKVGDLGATLMSRHGLKRLLKGELRLRGAFRFLLRQIDLRVLRPCAPYLGSLTKESRRFHRLHALFDALQSRDVPMLLVYASGDASLGELHSFMGRDLGRLSRYSNVRLSEISGADHNFTPEPARTRLRRELVSFFSGKKQPAMTATKWQSETSALPYEAKTDCILEEQT